MSAFIPIVSSSPPPMEHGDGNTWPEDDDDFGDFATVNPVSHENGHGFSDFAAFSESSPTTQPIHAQSFHDHQPQFSQVDFPNTNEKHLSDSDSAAEVAESASDWSPGKSHDAVSATDTVSSLSGETNEMAESVTPENETTQCYSFHNGLDQNQAGLGWLIIY